MEGLIVKDLKVMNNVQKEKAKEISKNGNPEISGETEKVLSCKRIAIDQPYTEVKYDPLR